MSASRLTQVAHGLVQVKISMSYPLRWVNSYVLYGSSGVVIVDPGPRSSSSEQEWISTMKELGLSWGDIQEVFVTHHHPDHYGLAGWIQKHAKCRVSMSRRAHQESELMWGKSSGITSELIAMFEDNGMPLEWTAQLPEHFDSFLPQVTPRAEVTYLEDKAEVEMGNQIWCAIQTGGHAPGHLSFFQKESRLLLCGDAVLPQISPNVSLVPGSDPEPLQTFLISLQQLSALEVDLSLPGHRNPFSHFQERTEALILHHEERLNKIAAYLEHEPRTGFELCVFLFGTKLGVHQMRFAMCEALAHIQELKRQGRAAGQLINGLVRYISI